MPHLLWQKMKHATTKGCLRLIYLYLVGITRQVLFRRIHFFDLPKRSKGNGIANGCYGCCTVFPIASGGPLHNV